jgi:putative acetyltransferase
MDRLQIRSASPADATALSDVIHRAVRTSNAPDYDPMVIELLCASFTPEKIIAQMSERDVFAAMLDEAIVGTVSFGRAKGRLNALFVDPQLHRQGIGARLVRHIEQHAAGAGVVVLWLSASITARPFYERLGYALHKFEERVDGSSWLMSKSLPSIA